MYCKTTIVRFSILVLILLAGLSTILAQYAHERPTRRPIPHRNPIKDWVYPKYKDGVFDDIVYASNDSSVITHPINKRNIRKFDYRNEEDDDFYDDDGYSSRKENDYRPNKIIGTTTTTKSPAKPTTTTTKNPSKPTTTTKSPAKPTTTTKSPQIHNVRHEEKKNVTLSSNHSVVFVDKGHYEKKIGNIDITTTNRTIKSYDNFDKEKKIEDEEKKIENEEKKIEHEEKKIVEEAEGDDDEEEDEEQDLNFFDIIERIKQGFNRFATKVKNFFTPHPEKHDDDDEKELKSSNDEADDDENKPKSDDGNDNKVKMKSSNDDSNDEENNSDDNEDKDGR